MPKRRADMAPLTAPHWEAVLQVKDFFVAEARRLGQSWLDPSCSEKG